MRPCTCDRVTSPTFSNDQCILCWQYHHNERYRKLWDRTKSNRRAPALSVYEWPCAYRGESVGVMNCGCSSPEPIYECHHPEMFIKTCITRKTIAGLIEHAECNRCPFHTDPNDKEGP